MNETRIMVDEKIPKDKSANLSRVKNFFLRSELITVYVIVTLVVGVTINKPSFLSFDNIIAMLKQFSFYGIMAVPLTFLMVSLAFDMSIGMIVAVSGSVGAILMRDFGIPFIAAFPIILMVGAFIGFCNGYLYAKVKISAFITTLSMMYILKGIFWVLTGQAAVVCTEQTSIIPDTIFNIPISIWILIILAIIGHIMLKYTKFGRSVYIVGNSPEVAREVGIKANKIKIILFTMLGIVGGICASAILATYKSLPTTTGAKYEFYVNAGTVIGGCSVYGGKGTIAGSLIGAAVMTVVQFSMRSLEVNVYWQTIFLGIILITAILIDTLKEKKRI